MFFLITNFFLTFLLKSTQLKHASENIHVGEGVYRGTDLLAYDIIFIEGLIRDLMN